MKKWRDRLKMECALKIKYGVRNSLDNEQQMVYPGLVLQIVPVNGEPIISQVKFLALSDHDIMHVIQHYQLEPIGFVSDVSHRKNQQERWSFRNVSTSSDSTRKEPRADMFREVRSVRAREFNDIPQISL